MPVKCDCPPSRIIALFCMLFALAVSVNNLLFLVKTLNPTQQANAVAHSETFATATDRSIRRPKLADGCYHVFIDAGSHIGMHVRFLLEPSLYPSAWIARKFFTAHLGPEVIRDNRDFCIFGFEPNPMHAKRHNEMSRAYSAMGWRYHYIPAGVGDKNDTLTFYDNGDELGFSAIPKKICRENECPHQQVPVYRLSDWIEQEVLGRKIPSQAFGGKGYVSGPKVVMKIDIEMLEWLVIPDLMTSGVLCRIDGVMGEFHLQQQWFLYPVTFQDSGGNGRSWTLHNYTEAEGLMNQMLGMIERNYHCNTKLEMRDDESHADDGMPWPQPQR
eukprot:CAMPEP_0183714722 /NCGR_PEP_ID=MMETSP0737-20130205/9178_1 /TAXON_ID=385413 /ORGANISM="Thalassiosira miniscula, Strain CCMP1093" /LENGTH=328 /DNA_ID=CAMNT_0025943715 /DNA_START=112 /DNA_END=1098 /DNA_ORIENTATION=-